MNKEITIDDILLFIVQNSDNTEVMDKINKATFPFTSKYANYTKKVFIKDFID